MIKTLMKLLKTKPAPVEVITWNETGKNLPSIPSWSPLAVPPTSTAVPVWPLDEVVRMVIVDLLQCPLQMMRIVEQEGRVVLALYQPHNHYDPLLPFPLINLGADFKREFRAMALELSAWVNKMFALEPALEMYNARHGYAHRSPLRPRPVSAALYYGVMAYHMERAIKIARDSGLLTPQEMRYFDYQLRLCIAQPDRFTDYDNEQWQARWQTAIQINNTLSQ